MKKIIALISIFVFIMSMSFSFAESLKVMEVTPKDGEKNVLQASFMMKVTFSENIKSEGNESYFKLMDEEGKPIAIQVVQGTESNRIDIMPDEYLEPGEKYELKIEPSVKSEAGNVLSEKYTSSFTTSKIKKDIDFKAILILFAVLAASGIVIQKTKGQMDKARKKRKEEQKREMKRMERREKKEKQRQKYQDKE